MSTGTHAPLPYEVTLRVVVDQDRPPTTVVREVLAYSVTEAIFSAAMEVAGEVPASADLTVERVRPNLRRWLDMLGKGLVK